jgi:alpha-L-fucosidase
MLKLRTAIKCYCLIIIGFAAQGQNNWKKIREELIVNDPPFQQCHASTIVQLGSGEVMAAWFGGSSEGRKDVVIWSAIKNKNSWSDPVVVADGIVNDSLRYPCWNPVLFRSDNHKLFLFYKVGPSPREWWGMMKTSMDDGKTWTLPVRLPDGLLGPIKNKPIQLVDGSILAPSSMETIYKWSVHIEKSDDEGSSWKKILIDTAGFDVIQPSILNYGKGKLQLLCRSKHGMVVQSWSSDNGNTWSKLSGTTLLNPNSGTDAITLINGEQLIVYNPSRPGKEWYNGRAELRVAVSADGKKWRDIMTLEKGVREEFSYPAVIQTKNGDVHVTYTYDRKNIKYVVIRKI